VQLKVEEWPTDRLREYERNPRKNDSVVDQMVAAIKEFGFRIPIVAMSSGEVVDGHLRLKAARALKMKAVPVALADDLTPAQIKAFRLLANKSASWAAWDERLLALELGELKALNFNLALTGFSLGEIAGLNSPGQSGLGSLAERFMVAPFSVLSARDGWWQDRKRAWIALGIQSELGRGENALGFSETILQPDPAKRRLREQAAGQER
jgi:hypothetical protein